MILRTLILLLTLIRLSSATDDTIFQGGDSTADLSRCGQCNAEKPLTDLNRCPCKTVYYCDKACQRAHWRKHKGPHNATLEAAKKKEMGEAAYRQALEEEEQAAARLSRLKAANKKGKAGNKKKNGKAAAAYRQALEKEEQTLSRLKDATAQHRTLEWVGDPASELLQDVTTTQERAAQPISFHPFFTGDYTGKYRFADPTLWSRHPDLIKSEFKTWTAELAEKGAEKFFKDVRLAAQKQARATGDGQAAVDRMELVRVFKFLDRQVRGIMPQPFEIRDSPHGGSGLFFKYAWRGDVHSVVDYENAKTHQLTKYYSDEGQVLPAIDDSFPAETMLGIYYGKWYTFEDVRSGRIGDSGRIEVTKDRKFAIDGFGDASLPSADFANDLEFTTLMTSLVQIRDSKPSDEAELKLAVEQALETYHEGSEAPWDFQSCNTYGYMTIASRANTRLKHNEEVSNNYGLSYWLLHADSPLKALGIRMGQEDGYQLVCVKLDGSKCMLQKFLIPNWVTGEGEMEITPAINVDRNAETEAKVKLAVEQALQT